MYKKINDRITIATRRNKTESNYVSKFIEACENIDNVENLLGVIYKLNSHKDIMRFTCIIKINGMWTDGSVSSVELGIYNSAFKMYLVLFHEMFQPNQMTKEECVGYVEFLKDELSTVA
jgi:hypothetical protein